MFVSVIGEPTSGLSSKRSGMRALRGPSWSACHTSSSAESDLSSLRGLFGAVVEARVSVAASSRLVWFGVTWFWGAIVLAASVHRKLWRKHFWTISKIGIKYNTFLIIYIYIYNSEESSFSSILIEEPSSSIWLVSHAESEIFKNVPTLWKTIQNFRICEKWCSFYHCCRTLYCNTKSFRNKK